MATRGLFLLPKGEGVQLSRSIVLDFESADKDEFVSYAEDKQRPSMKQHYKFSTHYVTNQAKSGQILSKQVTNLSQHPSCTLLRQSCRNVTVF